MIALTSNISENPMDCDLIIVCEHEIAVGRMKELG